MRAATLRGLETAVSYALNTPEFDRIRLHLVAEASSDKPESEEVILYVCNAVRDHLLAHDRAVKAIAMNRRAV